MSELFLNKIYLAEVHLVSQGVVHHTVIARNEDAVYNLMAGEYGGYMHVDHIDIQEIDLHQDYGIIM